MYAAFYFGEWVLRSGPYPIHEPKHKFRPKVVENDVTVEKLETVSIGIVKPQKGNCRNMRGESCPNIWKLKECGRIPEVSQVVNTGYHRSHCSELSPEQLARPRNKLQNQRRLQQPTALKYDEVISPSELLYFLMVITIYITYWSWLFIASDHLSITRLSKRNNRHYRRQSKSNGTSSKSVECLLWQNQDDTS